MTKAGPLEVGLESGSCSMNKEGKGTMRYKLFEFVMLFGAPNLKFY